jgi:hypothetical protein
VISTERVPRPSRFFPLVVIALILAAVRGGVGHLFGWMQGQANLQQATLHISVEDRLTTNQTVTLLINGKLRQSLTIPHGQIVSVDEQVTFAGPDGAWFDVRASNPSGPSDSAMVYAYGPGTYPVSFRLG